MKIFNFRNNKSISSAIGDTPNNNPYIAESPEIIDSISNSLTKPVIYRFRNAFNKVAQLVTGSFFRCVLDRTTKVEITENGVEVMNGAKFVGDGSELTDLPIGDISMGDVDNGRVIIADASGKGHFTTIQAAIDSISGNTADNRFTVLVYPGVYAEQVALNKDYVSLVGVDRKSCRIEHTIAGGTPIIYVTGGYGEIANIHIENTYNSGTDEKPALSVACSGKTFLISNCDIESGGKDTIWLVNITANCTLKDCYIRGDYDVISISSCSNIRLYNCIIEKNSTGNTAFIYADSTYRNCAIYASGNTLFSPNSSYTLFSNTVVNNVSYYDGGNAFYPDSLGMNTSVAPITVYTMSTDNINIIGDANIGGDVDIAGDISVVDAEIDGDAVIKGSLTLDNSNYICQGLYNNSVAGDYVRYSRDSADEYTHAMRITSDINYLHAIEFGTDDNTGGELAYDTNLYRSAANVLKTDDQFSADTLVSRVAKWQYFGGNALCNTEGSNWSLMSNNRVYTTTDNNYKLFYNVPFVTGTTLTSFKLYYQGAGANDGIKSILFRKTLLSNGTVTTIDTFDTGWVSTSIAVISCNITDTIMEDGYMYWFQVTSTKVTTGVYVNGWAIETSNRNL